MGTNPGVTRFCKDILIDEKIGGTIHIALGRAYPECGGTNKSAIHWDIVKDIRREGTVYADGPRCCRTAYSCCRQICPGNRTGVSTGMHLLGIDIGTYSSKGVLVRENGEVAADCLEHPLEMPQPGWAEHDAETTWWGDFLEITRTLLRASRVPATQVAGSGSAPSRPRSCRLTPRGTPAQGHPLRHRYSRHPRDRGAAAGHRCGPGAARVGVRLSSQSAAPKVLWIRRHEPDVWAGRTS